jgi:hypothetical protein
MLNKSLKVLKFSFPRQTGENPGQNPVLPPERSSQSFGLQPIVVGWKYLKKLTLFYTEEKVVFYLKI